MGTPKVKPRKKEHRIAITGTAFDKAKKRALGFCLTCRMKSFTEQRMNLVEDPRTRRMYAWHEYCIKPLEVMELEDKYAKGRFREDDVREPDAERVAMESAQREMWKALRVEFPDLTKRKRFEKLIQHMDALRSAWAREKAAREAAACKCSHKAVDHVAGEGPCKIGPCDCDRYEAQIIQ